VPKLTNRKLLTNTVRDIPFSIPGRSSRQKISKSVEVLVDGSPKYKTKTIKPLEENKAKASWHCI
jgi:hypothetical protein